MTSPVAGLRVGKVLPETLSCHLPPMNSGWSLTLGGFTVRGFWAVAVAMALTSSRETVYGCGAAPLRPLRWNGFSHRAAAVVKEKRAVAVRGNEPAGGRARLPGSPCRIGRRGLA